MERLFQNNLTFSRHDVEELLEKADIYPVEVRMRVQKILAEQMRKYEYLFEG